MPVFGLGWTEIGLILLVALLIFGPRKIPELGSALGKTLRGFKEEMGADRELEGDDGDRPTDG